LDQSVPKQWEKHDQTPKVGIIVEVTGSAHSWSSKMETDQSRNDCLPHTLHTLWCAFSY